MVIYKALLVEDNEIDRQMSMEILKNSEIQVQEAEDGLEALMLLEEGNCYDVIFMDLDMPILNGYKATQEIRKFDSKTPIIAISAHTDLEEGQKILEAGMNGYLSKPIEPSRMLTYIKKMDLLKPLPDQLPGLDVKEGLSRINGKVETYLQVLKLFKDSHLKYTEEIRSAILCGDTNTAVRLAHTLKGVSGGIGANELAGIAKRVQGSLSEGSKEFDLESDLKDLDEKLKIVINSILEILSMNVETHEMQPDKISVNVKENIQILLNFIQRGDFAVLGWYKEMKVIFSNLYGNKKTQELDDALQCFQWKAAHKILSDLLEDHN